MHAGSARRFVSWGWHAQGMAISGVVAARTVGVRRVADGWDWGGVGEEKCVS